MADFEDAEKLAEHTYNIRPNFKHKFRPKIVQGLIKEVLQEKLEGVTYHSENTSQWTREIADGIKRKLKALNLDRYKFVVQVVIGEQRGEGIRMACRCFWDSDNDSHASEIYSNDSLFCVAAAFGVYYY
ncbi:Tctex1 domain-containing protein 2 [Planoprotostelium fungivorum]|uniref:Tctex1 domain-containing protein 2 n=1 Tax=Planoprotostelium fungivorum TaxID=1890364 RepID=A0A2P6NQZ6_9EUKA|nr:Tctex1 domain-containing protein 2 [Planoprotostelium fungivorum]